MPIKGLSMNWRISGALLLAGLLFGTAALAQAPANSGAIVVTDSGGRLRIRIGDSEPQVVTTGQAIPVGARITTAPDAHVVLTFPDGMVVALGPRSRLHIRAFRYLPNDLGRSGVLLNLTDGSMNIVMGSIGQHDPSLVQLQVGTKNLAQAPTHSRGNDVGVIVLGIATLVQVTQGKVSLSTETSDRSYPLTAGERALVQADGLVRTGGPTQIQDQAGRTADGKTMLGRMDELRRYPLPESLRQTAIALSTPPSDDTLEDFQPRREDLIPPPFQPITGTLPTAATGAGGGGLPCGASCN
jgi:hypothetical protein